MSKKRVGVIGTPISHTLSPRIHNYWMKKYGIEGNYEAIEVKKEELPEFISSLKEKGFKGVNVTIPHKEAVIPLLDEVHVDAAAIGAVNTIVLEDGKTFGYNTDAQGFIANVQETIPDADLFEQKVVVLGSGGAARAVCVSLLQEGAKILLANRTMDRAQKLKAHLEKELSDYFGAGEASSITLVDWEKRSDALQGAAMLVNTTSLGMKGSEELNIDLAKLPRDAIVADIVYNPLETGLLKMAKQKGNKTVDGLGMLLYQAEPAFYAWFGKRPEVSKELKELFI